MRDVGSRWRRALWVVGLCVGVSSCVSVQRQARTTVGVDGVAGSTEDQTFDCDGNLTTMQRHQQVGGGVRVERQSSGPLRGGVRVHAVEGTLTAETGLTSLDPRRSPYTLVTTAGYLAADFAYWGVEGGFSLHAVIAPRVEGRKVMPLGWVLVHAGGRTLHVETFSGSVDPFTVWIIGGGLRVERESLRLRLGIGIAGRWIGNQDVDNSAFLSLASHNEYADVLAYAAVEYWPVQHFGLFASINGGSQPPMAMLGIRVALGSDGAEPPLQPRSLPASRPPW